MSYLDLLNEENIESQFLALIQPRIRLENFLLHSGSVYKKSIALWKNYDFISGVENNGVALSLGTSTALSAGEFFYEESTRFLYLRLLDSSSPVGKMIVTQFDLYFATIDSHWFRDPLDANTTQIFWEGIVKKTPQFKQSVSDILFGTFPVSSSSIELINSDHLFEKIIGQASFNKCRIQVWNYLKKLDVDNIKLVFDGVCGNTQYSDSGVTINVLDQVDKLSEEYRHPIGENYFDSVNFPNVVQQSIGDTIRKVYGFVKGVVPTDIDKAIDENNPTTSENRRWCVCNGVFSERTYSVQTGNTSTRTFLNNTIGLQVGDSVWLDRVSGADRFTLITNVAVNFIDHDSIPGSMTLGDTVRRGNVSRVDIFSNNIRYTPLYGRDYSCYFDAVTNTSGILFVNNFESTLSMPNALKAFDNIACRVYGEQNGVTLDGPSFGTNDVDTGNLTHPAVILVDLLKQQVGLTDSDIDSVSFGDSLLEVSYANGISIPEKASNEFPKMRDLVSNILKGFFGRLFINNDLEWSLDVITPFGAETATISTDEIIQNTFRFTEDYKDVVSDIILEYAKSERDELSNKESSLRELVTNNYAVNVHKISKQKTFESYLFKPNDAAELANRLGFYFGDRDGKFFLTGTLRQYLTQIDDTLLIEREKMPSFDFDSNIFRMQKIKMTSIMRQRGQVSIEGSDLKGVQDNADQW